jgi:hypothetical protein
MKYMIGIVFLVLTLGFLALFSRVAFLAFTDSWTWILVGVPILAATIVSGLITSVGLTAPRDY